MELQYLKQLANTFSPLIFNSLTRDITINKKTPEEALARLNTWDIKYGTGRGVHLTEMDVRGLLDTLEFINGTKSLPTNEVKIVDTYGLFYSFMEMFYYCVVNLDKATALQIAPCLLLNDSAELEKQYIDVGIDLLNKYWTQFKGNVGSTLTKDSTQIFFVLYRAAIEFKISDQDPNKVVLLGMSD